MLLFSTIYYWQILCVRLSRALLENSSDDVLLLGWLFFSALTHNGALLSSTCIHSLSDISDEESRSNGQLKPQDVACSW